MGRLGAGIAAAISLAVTVIFTFAFYDRYWRHRNCFNDRGNCWVSEDGINYTTSGFVWGPLAILFATLFAIALVNTLRR